MTPQRLDEAKAALETEVIALAALASSRQALLEAVRRELSETRTLYLEYAGKAHDAEAQVANLKAEILRLKARLYDMREEVTNLRELLGNYKGEEDQPL